MFSLWSSCTLILLQVVISFPFVIYAEAINLRSFDQRPNIIASYSPFQSRTKIPDASLDCSPVECAWWIKLQAAGKQLVKSHGGNKDVKAFSDLLAEGIANSYAVPIQDQKPKALNLTPPEYNEPARQQRLSGEVKLEVEFLANGTVGRVVVLNSLRPDLDQNAISAARKTIFLPAVKDRKFVDYKSEMQMAFKLY